MVGLNAPASAIWVQIRSINVGGVGEW